MATTAQKKRNLKYNAKDFESYKRDFIEHLKVYFPDTYADYSESSVGMMLTEMMAYIGDNLSFYLDKKFNESFIETAKESKNIFKHAKQLGYKAFGKSAATGKVSAYLEIPAIVTNGVPIPDVRYAGKILKGAKLKSKAGKTYETYEDIDFSKYNSYAVGKKDPTTEAPSTFILKVDDVDIKAGETKTTTFSVGAYKAFTKVTISEDDVMEIIKVTDSEANQWYEVDFLAQDTVFDGTTVNSSADSADVPYLMTLRSVPYRFITDFDIENNRMSLIFGTGDAQSFDGDLIPDLGDMSLPLLGKDTFSEFYIDPQNFLKTRTLGLAPVNTTLTVNYRVGGGLDTNAGAKEINSVGDSIFDVGNSALPASTVQEVASSFAVLNENPVQGGKDELTSDELRYLIPSIFASQQRVVTIEDYIARTLSMPSKFGSIFRANARKSINNKNSIELFVISKNSNGYVTTCPTDLKNNLKKYLSRFRMITDAIEILDSEVINLAINFGILVNADYNKTEVLNNCILALTEYFDVNKWQLGQPINTTDITYLLAGISGVLTIYDFSVVNRTANYDGRTYSSTTYNIAANTENGVIYCNNNAIFEVKYPAKDIVGIAK